jgi:hypothetical protein
MLEIGKLYICKEYYLMIYPDQETAAAAAAGLVAGAVSLLQPIAGGVAAFWSKRFGKPVSYAEKNIPLLILNDKEEYVEVLAGARKGWIIYQDWLELKEISNENIS